MIKFMAVILLTLSGTSFSKDLTCTRIFGTSIGMANAVNLDKYKNWDYVGYLKKKGPIVYPFFSEEFIYKKEIGTRIELKNVGFGVPSSKKPTLLRGQSNFSSDYLSIIKQDQSETYYLDSSLYTIYKLKEADLSLEKKDSLIQITFTPDITLIFYRCE